MIRNDTDYALRMLVHLAGRSPREASASELSCGLGVPHGFAQKILRRLSAGGILRARPGRHGGFTLDRSLENVSLMDVIAAIQGPPLLNRCLGAPDSCSRQVSCRIQASLRPFQEELDAFLCATTLSDILTQPPARSPQAQRARSRAGLMPTLPRGSSKKGPL